MNTKNYKSINKCLVCGNENLDVVLDLGVQSLTGVFPRSVDEAITRGPLVLKRCAGGENVCGLLQLGHSYNQSEMYGENYGYRSGLNITMVRHLQSKIEKLERIKPLAVDDLVLDIGSNDGTSLHAYSRTDLTKVGMDPTGEKFKEFYPSSSHLIPDFYSHTLFEKYYPRQRASIITSFAMFYDLENPQDFMHQIYRTMADDGIWCFEQSYMPAMLSANAYDTVCHEHLEFYGLTQIKWMTDRAKLKIIDLEFNDTNGGSFAVTVAREDNASYPESKELQPHINIEVGMQLHSADRYRKFSDAVVKGRHDLREFIGSEIARGKQFAGLGASTKGNVLLQYCGLDSRHIKCIGDVNPDKYGKFTPGTGIPIIPEDEALASAFDYYLVLPWHFRKYFDENSRYKGVNLVYPLPELSQTSRRDTKFRGAPG